jgi:flagellar biosynthesis/type III secretory pathway chaperone
MDLQPIESLISLLQQEHAIYCEMASLLAEERQALLAMAFAQVSELAGRKETLALRIKALDESRKLLARRLGAQCGLPSDQVTVNDLAACVPGPQAQRLRTVGAALRHAVQQCQELNRHNERAARRGLELVTGAIHHLIDAADPAGKVYQAPHAPGYPAARRGKGGSSGFLSREG